MHNHYSTNPVTGDLYLLDLFSTSPKIDYICKNRAPYLCVPERDGVPGHIAQGCCNDWTCPRCGHYRARHEYGRLVNGARLLAYDHQLWFITISCRGDVSQEQAERDYLANTNQLLDAFRCQVKKSKGHWAYAGVTERQKRGHPHSHYLMSCAPNDVFNVLDDYDRYKLSVQAINEQIDLVMRFTAAHRNEFSLLDYHSNWLMLQSVKSGLGVQARVSIVDVVEGCSRYIAKYLFKQTVGEDWPKGWKRIRYSQSWPKLPERQNSNAFVIRSAWDWHLAGDSGMLVANSYTVYERAIRQGLTNVVYTTKKSDTLTN